MNETILDILTKLLADYDIGAIPILADAYRDIGDEETAAWLSGLRIEKQRNWSIGWGRVGGSSWRAINSIERGVPRISKESAAKDLIRWIGFKLGRECIVCLGKGWFFPEFESRNQAFCLVCNGRGYLPR